MHASNDFAVDEQTLR